VLNETAPSARLLGKYCQLLASGGVKIKIIIIIIKRGKKNITLVSTENCKLFWIIIIMGLAGRK